MPLLSARLYHICDLLAINSTIHLYNAALEILAHLHIAMYSIRIYADTDLPFILAENKKAPRSSGPLKLDKTA